MGKIMKNRFNITNAEAMKLRFHTQTGGSTLTAQQPLNNIIRVTIQALAAVLGGTQSLHTNSYDEALGLPTEESVRIALKTQQIIAYESGVADTIDPLAGSYAIEAMTNEIEKKAMEYIEKIDQMGGMIKAIETGYVQKEIHESAYKQQLAIDKGEEVIVGVNKFQMEEDVKKREILKVDPELEKKQVERLKKLKERRDNEKVRKSLQKIKEVASTQENLFPYVLEAVKAYATVGEISNALRDVFGEYTETVII